jgi:methylmalonyl-CoA mutase
LLAAGGIQPLQSAPLDSLDAASSARVATPHEIVVLCATDARYAVLVPELVPRLKADGEHVVCLAGRPGEQERAHRTSGIDHFLHAGCDALAVLDGVRRSAEGA